MLVFRYPEMKASNRDQAIRRRLSQERPDLPDDLQFRLSRFQRLLWARRMATAALAGCFGLGVSFLMIFGLERFVTTSPLARQWSLILGFTFPILVLVIQWARWVQPHRTFAAIARIIRRRRPRVGDELLGLIDLSEQPLGDASSGLVKAAMRQAADRFENENLRAAMPREHYKTWFILTAIVAAACGLTFLITPEAARNSLLRWSLVQPSPERFTFAQVKEIPNEPILPLSETIHFPITLEADSLQQPAEAILRLRGLPEQRVPLTNEVIAETTDETAGDSAVQTYAFTIPPLASPTIGDLRVGDFTQTLTFQPTARPTLESWSATLQWPAYLQRDTTRTVAVQTQEFAALAGTQVQLAATVRRPVATASATLDGRKVAVEISAADGQLRVPRFTLDETRELELDWVGRSGLTPKASSTVRFRPTEDQAPRVAASRVSEVQNVFLPSDLIEFQVEAEDDFGVRRTGLEWLPLADFENELGTWARDASKPYPFSKIIGSGGPYEETVSHAASFSAEREGISPQVVQVRAFAEDFLPTRSRSYSDPILLNVLSDGEHARWLAEEFTAWYRQMRETYERETVLYAGNEAIQNEVDGSDRKAELLGDSEQQAKLGASANAEVAQARQLQALTERAEQLLDQGKRNPQFSTNRVSKLQSATDGLRELSFSGIPDIASRLASADTLSRDNASLEAAEKEHEAATEKQFEQLAEFDRLINEFGQLTAQFESSTFVRRLIALADRQKSLGRDLGQVVDRSFGRTIPQTSEILRKRLETKSAQQRSDSDFVREIQSDLNAYFQRRQEPRYKHVLDQMNDFDPALKLRQSATEIATNLSGRTLIRSEFFASTFNKWAEELVPMPEQQPEQDPNQQQEQKPPLPPDVKRSISQLITQEVALRTETREAEAAKPALAPDVYESRAAELETFQERLRADLDDVISKVENLPNAESSFANQLKLFRFSSDVMREARAELSRPNTGDEAVAAQTEVIELLLQSQRNSDNQSSSSNSSASGQSDERNEEDAGSNSAEKEESEVGADRSRDINTTTGREGRELPDEFRFGLDQYFNQLGS